MATPQTLARKGSKGHAPRIVAGGIDTSSSKEEEQLPVRNEKVCGSTYLMLHRFTDIGSCYPHSQAEKPYGGVDGAADGQGDTAKQVAGQDTCH